uniref:VWFA domain-containing protein n=1 Tax=Oryzias latipes TaxID=8090 RepID=A0A3P9LKS9_ORYLA
YRMLLNISVVMLYIKFFFTSFMLCGYLSPAGGDKKDVVFLIDGTTSTRNKFPSIRNLMRSLVEKLDIGLDKARVSVVQYSDESKLEFPLNEFSTKNEVQERIMRLTSKGGTRRNTGRALEWVSRNIYQRSAGSRIEEGVPQFLIVLLGGKSSDDVSRSSASLKRLGIASVPIGSADADSNELKQISSNPEVFYIVNNFEQFARNQPTFMESLTSTSTGDITRPVFICVESVNLIVQNVRFTFPIFLSSLLLISVIIKQKVINSSGKSSKQADIVFLVDGSINLGRSNFEAVMQFINSMIDNLYDDESSLQISLAQYAADVTDAFFLNTYDNKENIVTAIEQVQYRGGPRINTGAAIRHIQNVHFTKERGSRMDQGVPQILMVVTGGASADDSRTASLALQRKGIRVYAVGAGNIQTELEGIASESTTVARSSNFQAISDLVELLMPALTEELKGQKLCVTESLTPRSTNFEQALLLEFGRGFKYTRPLKLNIMDLDYELLDELVSLINQSFIYCLHKHVNMKFFSPHRITL